MRLGGNYDQLGGLVLLRDRLLCSDGGQLHCLVARDDESKPRSEAPRGRQGELTFVVENLARSAGSRVLRCRTRGPKAASFLIEEEAGVLSLRVESVEDGELLLAAFSRAFPGGGRTRVAEGKAVAPPVRLRAHSLLEDTADSGWEVLELTLPFTDEEDAEATLAFSEKANEGYIEGKEDNVRPALRELVARLLVR